MFRSDVLLVARKLVLIWFFIIFSSHFRVVFFSLVLICIHLTISCYMYYAKHCGRFCYKFCRFALDNDTMELFSCSFALYLFLYLLSHIHEPSCECSTWLISVVVVVLSLLFFLVSCVWPPKLCERINALSSISLLKK